MKKQAVIITVAIILIAIIVLLFSHSGTTIKDEGKIENIKKEAYLDFIINLGEFTSEKYHNEKLLDVAMQLATNLGMLNTYQDDEVLIEYVTREDLHHIIYELTGILVEAPIEVEDFYYLYDGENDYYYFRPATPAYYTILKVNSIKENGNHYFINCEASKIEDTETSKLENVQISLTYMPKNEYIKYQVNKVSN